MSASDIITSAPSVWGAANAASAVALEPAALIVAIPLAAFVSDPAEMWHAGERYGQVAKMIQSASEKMTEDVKRHALDEHWNEEGRNAFMADRLTPYQDTLDQAATMYLKIEDTLMRCAEGYTAVGLASALLGSATVAFATAALARKAVDPMGISDYAVMRVLANIAKGLAEGLGKLNSFAMAILKEFAKQRLSDRAIDGLRFMGLGVASLVVGVSEGIDLTTSRTYFTANDATLNWLRQQPEGSAMPAGYHAPSAKDQAAIKKIRPESITALGKDLTAHAGEDLGAAYDLACHNEVGHPGFGVVGVRVGHAHVEMRDHAAAQLAACRDTPGTWLPGLRSTAANWIIADQAGADAAGHIIKR